MKRSDLTDEWILEQREVHDVSPQPFYYAILEANPHIPPKVLFRAIERCIAKGYMDYGISPCSAWITKRGKEYLMSQYLMKGCVGQ